MTYRLTTIEQDAAGNVSQLVHPYLNRSTLFDIVRVATACGFLTVDGYLLEAGSATNLTTIAVEFTSEDTP